MTRTPIGFVPYLTYALVPKPGSSHALARDSHRFAQQENQTPVQDGNHQFMQQGNQPPVREAGQHFVQQLFQTPVGDGMNDYFT